MELQGSDPFLVHAKLYFIIFYLVRLNFIFSFVVDAKLSSANNQISKLKLFANFNDFVQSCKKFELCNNY